jgi:dUTP pyrophosphatase
MEPVELRVRLLRTGARMPARATASSSGFDLYACLDQPMTLGPTPALVPTGIALEFPPGFDVQVRPRSGLSLKGVGVAFGTIDADYRGEVFVTMWTFGGVDRYELQPGDRIAQLVVARLAAVDVVQVQELTPSSRGEGGHGSTGR